MYNTENRLVLENLLSHKPGNGDGLKIGLVIQGGGMRGAFSAGVAKVITEFGLNDNFDDVYASSSGCNTAAYMLSGQADMGITIYTEDLTRFWGKFNFLRPWRIGTGKAMNLDYLVDVVMGQRKPLNLKKVRDSKTTLKMYVTDYESGHLDYFTNHQNIDFLSAIKATCAFPNFFPPVMIGGKSFLDGNIATILPIEQAIADRCTDILVIATVPESHHEPSRSRKLNFFQVLLSRKFTIDFKEVRGNRVELYNHNLDLAFGREIPNEKVRIYTIAPTYKIHNTDLSSKSVKRFLLHGVKIARDTLESVLSLSE